jgi:predicted transcriptional regulator
MPRKATTFRLDDDVQARLATLSKFLHQPMNRLVNEAVKHYVARRSRDVERELEESLANLRAYRELDPDFEQAIAAFAKAEVSAEDPFEGQVAEYPAGSRAGRSRGPVQKEIDQLLNGRLGRK